MATPFGMFFTALGYLVGGLVFYWAARQRGMATEGIRSVATVGLVGGVFGAKLTQWVLVDWQSLAAHPTVILDPAIGGRTIIGGILFGWAAVEFAKRRLGIRRSTGDCFALALPAGEAVGRIGCFLNSCSYGTLTTVGLVAFLVVVALAFAALGGVCFVGAQGTSDPIGIFFIPAAIFWFVMAAMTGYAAVRAARNEKLDKRS